MLMSIGGGLSLNLTDKFRNTRMAHLVLYLMEIENVNPRSDFRNDTHFPLSFNLKKAFFEVCTH